MRCSGRNRIAVATVALSLLAAPSAFVSMAIGHETDQYTMPTDREFGDFGPYLTKIMYDAIAGGVEKQNARIKSQVEGRASEKALKELESADEIASAVNGKFPVAVFFIDSLSKKSLSNDVKPDNPGRLVGYQNNATGLRRYIDLPLNPFNAWSCATVKAFGVYMGTDKIGHFTDMGKHYYETWSKAKQDGKSDDEAMKKVLHMGTEDPIYSERGLLGLATAGAYSNADLVANYMGLCFYRNLTEPIMLKGQMRPPLLVKDGHYWKIADHVRPDSDFFSWFISDHLNEALNPSLYRNDMRSRIKKAIEDSRGQVLTRYTDDNGNPLSQEQFEAITKSLFTYWGADYGHNGGTALMTIGTTCFAPLPDRSSATARNEDGLLSIHAAAAAGDLAAMQQLIGNGADVNARVETKVNAPAVNGDTALHLAAKNGQVEAVNWLINHGADVKARNDRGGTALHMAVEHPPVAEALIKHGAEIDATDAAGRTPLHWAARDRMASAGVKMLLDSGAKPQPTDRDGQTPLHDAARSGVAQSVVALIRAGGDVNAKDRFGITPLHIAAAENAPAVCDLFVRAGADANARDDFGCTPIAVATRMAHAENVAMLMARGANVAVADDYGKTPVTIAKDGKHNYVAKLLEGGAKPGEAQPANFKQPAQPQQNNAQLPLSNAR